MSYSIPDVLLDPRIKAWVLLPISVVMVLVGVLRAYISLLLEPSPKIEDAKLIRENQHIARLGNYCRNGSVLTYDKDYQYKIAFFNTEYTGVKYLATKPNPKQEPQNPLTDSRSNDFMMQVMKNSMSNIIPQSIIMWWVNFFFRGYAIMKLPFIITANFKPMLQTSIMTPDLDATYVSSISWYFVNLLGLKTILSLIFNDESLTDRVMAQQEQSMMIQPQMAGAGPTPQQKFQNQLDTLQITSFKSCLQDAPQRVVNRYGGNK